MFLTKARDMRGAYLKRLDVATLSQSGTEDGTFPNISWALAKGVCRGLFDQLRQRNGPAVTGFRSLPDDAKVEIFMRLRSAANLAMVECTCRDLRRVVAEHDGELWRRMYTCCSQSAPSRKRMWWPSVSWEDLMFIDKAVRRTQRFCRDEFEAVYERVQHHCQWRWFVPVDVRSSDEGVLRWKEKYLLARNRLCEGCLIPSPGVPLLSWTLCDPPKLEGDETGKIFVGQQQKLSRARSAYNEKRNGRRGAGASHRHLLAIDGVTGL
nr:unnamed protein product [Digitaria exilis]